MVAYKKFTKIIMKITFPLIVLLSLAFSKQAHACSCSTYWNTKEKIESANYVALVKVIDIVPANKPDQHKIKVTEQILYKGNSVTEIIVAGGSRALDSTKWSSCDLSIKKGEELIIYGHKIGDDIEIGFCSDPLLYKNKDGYRDLNLGFKIKELNEVNSYFSKPLLTFTKKNGTLKLYYPNGKKEATIQFKNGLKHGESKYYYPDGTINGEAFYVNDNLNGVRKTYYEDGVMESLQQYENGIKVDTSFFYGKYKYNPDKYFLSTITVYNQKGVMTDEIIYQFPNSLKPGTNYIQREKHVDAIKNEEISLSYHNNGRLWMRYITNTVTKELIGDDVRYNQNGNVTTIVRMVDGKRKVIYDDKIN